MYEHEEKSSFLKRAALKMTRDRVETDKQTPHLNAVTGATGNWLMGQFWVGVPSAKVPILAALALSQGVLTKL